MKVLMIMKDGSQYEFDNVKNDYVQNGKLFVIEHYLSLTDEEQLSSRKIPLEDIEQIQELKTGFKSQCDAQRPSNVDCEDTVG